MQEGVRAGVNDEKQKEINLQFKGKETGKRRIDFLVENEVVPDGIKRLLLRVAEEGKELMMNLPSQFKMFSGFSAVGF
jgi:hypothetical protein